MTTPQPNSFGPPPSFGPPLYEQPPYGHPPAQPQPLPQSPAQPYGSPPPDYGQYGQPGYGAPVPPEQPAKQRLSWKATTFFGVSGVMIAALVVAGIGSRFLGNSHGARVGDCVQYTPPNSGKIVNCSSAKANTVVIHRYELALLDSCRDLPRVVGSYTSSYRNKGKSHTYLACLGPHTPGKSS